VPAAPTTLIVSVFAVVAPAHETGVVPKRMLPEETTSVEVPAGALAVTVLVPEL
jgi:hypothetical protein